ncbi:hypothetical protein [Bacillus sp. B-jedd]|uniref:hypothetical protein n=1 Tax=Bacillus sp. B-jedd TaxID=1476857 RepID=UPI0005156659|nr:hypothetical protein [Bacillus sp. B-jedd]CEG27250.1 hypothetical protein BN1002_02106 [Bacillus sp. B-jedd]
MPQYLITYMNKKDRSFETVKIMGDRISDIYQHVFELEKNNTIVSIENTALSKKK